LRAGHSASGLLLAAWAAFAPAARAATTIHFLPTALKLPATTATISFHPHEQPEAASVFRVLRLVSRALGPDQQPVLGGISDPLASRASAFVGARKALGRFGWEGFGGPMFLWATLPREMCERTSACSPSLPWLHPLVPTDGPLWVGGGGPVVRLVEGLGAVGRPLVAVEASLHGDLVGFSNSAGPKTGVDVGLGFALRLPSVAIHLQLQAMVYAAGQGLEQSLGHQLFATVAIDQLGR
jgi:hypothetical protein